MVNEEELKAALILLVYWYDGVLTLGELEHGLASLSIDTINCLPDKLESSNYPALKETILNYKKRMTNE